MNLQDQVYHLIEKQLRLWGTVRENYENLNQIKIRIFSLGKSSVIVQFNPTRIISTTSNTDAASLSKRKCFLCLENQPKEEIGITTNSYTIQINPYPIFPNHLVIAYRQHIEQNIDGHLVEILEFARQLPNFAVFFNGKNCGASAPDHLHFQAAPKQSFPILKDYLEAKKEPIFDENFVQTYQLLQLHRAVFCIESKNVDLVVKHFEMLSNRFFGISEPMLNLLCEFEDEKLKLFVFPRKTSRPWQYFAPEPHRLMVSPGTAEMSGVLVIPVEQHFYRITPEDIIDIYRQITKI